MRTKIMIIAVFFLLLSMAKINAQDINTKLLVKYDKAFLEEVKTQNPVEYDLLVHYVEDGCKLTDMPDKPIDFEDLKRVDPRTGEISQNQDISISDLENLNPLEYNIKYHYSNGTYYRVKNLGKLIIVSSGKDMENHVKNYRRIQQLNIKK